MIPEKYESSGVARRSKHTGPAPLVSVIIPFFKKEAFLKDTVESVKNQTYPNLEIIVVDDGSPVPASSILGEQEEVTVIWTENRGCPAARNRGFQASSGEYLIFLDSDDRLLPGAIEAHLQAFAEQPNAVLSFGAVRIIDENDREIFPAHSCRPRKNYFLLLLETNPIGCPGAVMLRRNDFVQAGLFDEHFRILEDYRLYLRLARSHEFAQHSFCVVEYRSYDNSLSRDKEGMLTSTMLVLDLVEQENLLTRTEIRRLKHGRRRWRLEYRPRKSILYSIRRLYYRLLGMRTLPLRSLLAPGR